MNKVGTLILGAIIGLILGGGLVFYFFAGAPRAVKIAGAPIQPPDAANPQPATAQVVLRQEFFNEVLTTIFRDVNPPSFALGAGANADNPASKTEGQCESRITLLPENGDVKSSLNFAENKLGAPLAFSGSYSSMFGCFNFSGLAQSNMEMRFDADRQLVFGQLNIEAVNLNGVNPLLSGIITPLVQSTLNQQVNPVQILDANKLAFSLPLKASSGKLNARVKDVRSEIVNNALNLYLIYEMTGEKTPQ